MDHFRIRRLTETDFDTIIALAGGRRLPTDDGVGNRRTADYVLHEAAIELKLVEEEGLEKETRQQRLADLFRRRDPDRPVHVIAPESLDATESFEYYQILRTPLKTHVRTASRQLDATCAAHGLTTRALLIINNGYATMSHEEFKDVALRCAQNDTTRIDYLLVGGIYYFSDTVDNYFFTPFELCPINIDRGFSGFRRLRDSWNHFGERFMTSLIQSASTSSDEDKLPVIDLSFTIDGVTFVKPAPKIRSCSPFWPGGVRPRYNSTGQTMCNSVAKTFPSLEKEDWAALKRDLPDEPALKETFDAWADFVRNEDTRCGSPQLPFVPVAVTHEAWSMWCVDHGCVGSFSALCECANDLFEATIRKLITGAQDRSQLVVSIPEYVYLLTEEIGRDTNNDVSSAYHVCELPAFEKKDVLFSNLRIPFEQALALAASHALKHRLSLVVYTRDKTYASG
jgi:hypothetical protein